MQLLSFGRHISKIASVVLRCLQQEDEKGKIKERLQNCFREQILSFCAYLDIQGVSSLGKVRLINLVRKIFEFVEHSSVCQTRMEKYKENQEKELKKKRKQAAIEDPSYEDIRKAIWKALKIIGKPHKKLINCASIIVEKELDADAEEVKRALRDVLENFDGNRRE
ncbi:hypothetical protein MKX01_015529 [Papaver californicum]|nr:hypothetical protein MKX01_015529 [Papaver californicum]